LLFLVVRFSECSALTALKIWWGIFDLIIVVFFFTADIQGQNFNIRNFSFSISYAKDLISIKGCECYLATNINFVNWCHIHSIDFHWKWNAFRYTFKGVCSFYCNEVKKVFIASIILCHPIIKKKIIELLSTKMYKSSVPNVWIFFLVSHEKCVKFHI
jgi:hypothetical protein